MIFNLPTIYQQFTNNLPTNHNNYLLHSECAHFDGSKEILQNWPDKMS
jgi:hypothetical protein